MTAPQGPQGVPVAAGMAENLVDTDETEPDTPTVGSSDAEADAARSGADADLTDPARDSDGVPVGQDDVEADRRASGA